LAFVVLVEISDKRDDDIAESRNRLEPDLLSDFIRKKPLKGDATPSSITLDVSVEWEGLERGRLFGCRVEN
jgi:hypothetical protein